MAKIVVSRTLKIVTAHRLAGPHIRKTSNLIIAGARRLAPRGNHLSGSGKRRSGDQLAASLHINSRSTVNTIVEKIGSKNNYATSEHQGSSPHVIVRKGRMLKFVWPRGDMLIAARAAGRTRGRRGGARRSSNGFFYFSRVRHPGNKRPVRYLTTPMHQYGRMNGFRTTSTPVSRSRLP